MKARCIIIALLVIPAAIGCDDRTPRSSQNAATAPPNIADEKIESSLAATEQYMQTGEWVKAEAIIRTLIARSPNDSRVQEMIGRLNIEKAGNAEEVGDLSSAMEFKKQAWLNYQQAVRLNPDSAGLNQSAGLIAITAGDPSAALTLFLKAESLDHSNPQYPLYAAQVLMQKNRLDEAEAALQRVLAIQADEPLAHASLAMIALERGQLNEALAEIRTARTILPDDAGLRAQEAKVHRRRGETREALELLIGLDEASRAQEAVTFEIAAAYEALDDLKKAGAAWALCARANPRSPTAYLAAVRAGELFLKAGDKAEAAKWGSAAAQLRPDAPEVLALHDRLRAAAGE